MSEQVGLPLSTLAKVESNKLSLTYDKLQQLALRLEMTLPELLAKGEIDRGHAAEKIVSGRRSLATGGNSIKVSTPSYDYEYLCADLRNKRMVPIITRIRAQSMSEFGELLSHRGEEFIYVLEGEVEVHSEVYATTKLMRGQGVYLDSSMGHAYLASGGSDALVLAVCAGGSEDLADELIGLAAAEAATGRSSGV